MVREGTFEDYRNRLNARRRELTALPPPPHAPPKKQSHGRRRMKSIAAGTPHGARTGGTTKAIELVGASSGKTLPLTMAASRLDWRRLHNSARPSFHWHGLS